MDSVLVRNKGWVRLVLSVDLICQSSMVEVDSAGMGPIDPPIPLESS
jgi:hypothetical protein